ncbi:glycosyltransferase family 2 protein [Terrisporobacter glycolicus]|uniref:glycosyltransferase family 2 protein n=1 Tax=Terrisporobacter petrolearius TaxID=1460447 RepID=UPI0011DDF47A
MPKVSIIVPIYKVEKYLRQCIDSIINQSLKDIEIILVDDGSPDNCPRICDEYKEKDIRIKVIHKKNGGLSSARNAGMKIATGEYIGFVDSDDYIENDMYKKMYNTAKKYDVDLVMSDYYKVNGNNRKEVSHIIDGGFYNKEKIKTLIYPQLIMKENIDYGPLLAVCYCLYKNSFLKSNHICFDEIIKYSEDNLFSSIVGYKAKSYYYMKKSYFYNYRYNPNSISTTYKPDSLNVYIEMNNRLYETFYKCEEFNFNRQLHLHMIYYTFNYINQVNESKLSFKKKYMEIRNVLRNKEIRRAFDGLKLPNVNLKLKLCILMLKFKMTFAYMIIRAKGA